MLALSHKRLLLLSRLLQTGGRRSTIVVSTLSEADFFAERGFDDVLYAVPLSPDKIEAAAGLHGRITFHVMIDHAVQLEALLAHPLGASAKPWSVFIMVDCGYRRDGVDPEDAESLSLAMRIASSSQAELAGIYTHGGHSYDAAGPGEITRVAAQGASTPAFPPP